MTSRDRGPQRLPSNGASLLGWGSHVRGVFPLPGIEGMTMTFTFSMRGVVKTMAVVLSLAMPLTIAISSADARVGGGSSSGSRGNRTFSAPPSTSTAPNAAQPFNRTMTQPGSPGLGAGAAGAAHKGGFFNRPGLGVVGGGGARFPGAGRPGMAFGGGGFIG